MFVSRVLARRSVPCCGERALNQTDLVYLCFHALPFKWNTFWVKNKSCKSISRILESLYAWVSEGMGLCKKKNTSKQLEVLVSSPPLPEVWNTPHRALAVPPGWSQQWVLWTALMSLMMSTLNLFLIQPKNVTIAHFSTWISSATSTQTIHFDHFRSIPGLRYMYLQGSWAIPRQSPIQVLTKPDPA